MIVPILHSIQEVSIQYATGDLPILVLCSDKQQYVCKYARPSITIAYKLTAELIGSQMALAWNLKTPAVAFVNISPAHWATISTPHSVSLPAIGFRKIENVVDITPMTFRQVPVNESTIYQLLKVALFDFWIANEDRTANNANLLYDVKEGDLISIDYGGVLNNVSFDFRSTQLTETDSILCSDLGAHLLSRTSGKMVAECVDALKIEYNRVIKKSKKIAVQIQSIVPKEWAMPLDKLNNKLDELLSEEWCHSVLTNFAECLKSNSNYE